MSRASGARRRSTPGSSRRSFAYADAFERFFEELGLRRPHVAGNSMGGGIALELARRGSVSSATAISPVGFWTPRERRFCQLVARAARTTSPPRCAGPSCRWRARAPAERSSWDRSSPAPGASRAADARSTLEDFWAAPAFSAALAAFDGYVFRAGHELRHVPVTVAWGSRDRLLLFGRQAPRARRALPDAHHVTLTGLGHTPFYDDPDDGGRGDAARHRGGARCVGSRRSWSCSPRCRPPRRRRPLRCPASAPARTCPRPTGAACSGAGSSTASACPPTATGSTRRATRAPAGPSSRTWPTPPTPGRSSATTTWWPTPTTTATRSSGARTACTSGSTATRPPTASTPAASDTCAPAAGRSARSTRTGRAARAPSACSAAGYSRRTLAAAGLAVDEHVYAPFGDDPVLLHDVTIRNTHATGRGRRAGSSTGA